MNAARPRWRSMGWLLRNGALRVGGFTPRKLLMSLARDQSPVIAFRLAGRRAVLLQEPELIRELLVTHANETTKGPAIQRTRPILGNGLLTSEGDSHRRARRLVGAAFAPSRLDEYFSSIAEETTALSREWRGRQEIDTRKEMATLALRIVGATLLGTDLSDETDRISRALSSALQTFARSGVRDRRRSVANALDREATELKSIVEALISERRTHTDGTRNVVSALISASHPDEARPLSDDEVRDQVMTLMMAGHETTANALTFSLLLLAQHPTVVDQIRSEVNALNPQKLTRESLNALPFTKAVIAETIRLYPPAWIFGRELTEPQQFGQWQVPAGTIAGVSPWLLHRNPTWFPAPDTYDPERWVDDRAKLVPKYAFIPFGAGPRGCIGERFAWMEAITATALLVRDWDFSFNGGTVDLEFGVTLRPAQPVDLGITPRAPIPLSTVSRDE